MKKIITIFVIFLIVLSANGQILTNSTPAAAITNSNAFLDASTNYSSAGFANNDNHKGLVFPDVNLTTFQFENIVADGIAFSCGNTKKQQPSLKFIFKAVNKTVYSDKKDITTFDPDLTRWSNQGVLMLNTSLTTEIDKIGKHIPIWDPFIKYLIDMLNSKDKDYVWVLIGKQAQENEDLIDNILRNTQILKCSHPASAAYKKDEDWNCNDIFNQVNNTLLYNKKSKIIW